MLRFRRSGSVAGSGAIEVPGVRRKECTHIGRGTPYDETDRFLAGCIHNSGRRCRLHGLRPGHINSCVPHQYSGRTTRRSPSAHCGHALARARDRRRRLARRAARDAPGARAILGDGLRLAQGRSAAQRLSPIRHDDRWRGHSLHPCALASSTRLAADHDPRLARVDLRAAEDRGAAHGSDGLRRTGGGRVRPRPAFDSRLRLFRQADAGPDGLPTASRASGQR